MSRRRKKHDRHKFGRHDYRAASMDWTARHQARHAQANGDVMPAYSWASMRGVSLTIQNYGHHWIFRRNDTIAEWWPSSAKLVLQKLWREGIHVHRWSEVRQILEQVFPIGSDVQIVAK